MATKLSPPRLNFAFRPVLASSFFNFTLLSNMQLALVLAALFASSVAASPVSALSVDERDSLEKDLAAWKEQFEDVARKDGLLPNANGSHQESANVDDQLQRLLDTKHAVQSVSRQNPDAVFDWRNKFALMTDAEFKKYVQVSFNQVHYLRTDVIAHPESAVVQAAVAASKDWTTSGCVNPVQNQGQCGSCWAFSAVGVAESANCIKTGKLLKLSEQQVTSCSTNGGSQGCNGGYPWSAIDYTSSGVCLAKDYAYISGGSGSTGSCKSSCTKQKLSIGKSVRVSGDANVINAISKQPVSVTVAAGNSVWRNYKSGVVSSCPTAQSDHAVIAVGYDGTSIKVRNSWGTTWGVGGYITLKRGSGGQGTCNVVGAASYPSI
ncbi:hypothetical protein LEN26_014572 [Aphanomyces euteiches]|nr:hypothetical protein LEN26_014572 [Aphanomyces euteiches]